MKKAYIATDLGPGDGGKGGVVHAIAVLLSAHTIIKKGGFQGNHGVFTSRGERMAFSQWGCGTLDGIRTHISTGITVSPEGLLNEADQLQRECCIADPWSMLTIDENALCGTEFHGISSRLKELARGKDPRGTIGTGAGETYRYNLSHPELSVFVRDLSAPNLRDKLVAIREQMIRDLDSIINGNFLAEDNQMAQDEIDYLLNPESVDDILARFREVARLANIVDPDYMGREILSRDGVVVVETSHGILTDRYMGFEPHTSAIRTLPGLTRQMLLDAGYDGQIVDIAIHRGYTIRHGAGPMPTTDPTMGEHLLPGSHKDVNRWQGDIRVGPLDLNLLRYAIEASGGPNAYTGLALTWFDQVAANGEWKICRRYKSGTEDRRFFTEDGRLRVRFGENEDQLTYTRELTRQLFLCEPEIETIPIPKGATPQELFHLVESVLNDELGVELTLLSVGPTEADKVLMRPKSMRA